MMKFIFSYLIILGIIFSFLIPPFQKPDETTHFKKTLAISHGLFNCPKNNQIKIDKQFADLLNQKNLQNMIAKKNYKIKLNNWFLEVINSPTTKSKSLITINRSVCQLPTVSYIPQAFGLLISQFLNFNQYFSFFFGRLIGFLIFFVWFLFLYKLATKPIKNIILLTFAIPMTIHQLTSYSYDGVQIMLAFTVFVSCTKILEKTKKKIWFFVLPLSVLFFLLSRSVVKVAYPASINPAGQIEILKNPATVIEVFAKTTFLKLPFYLQSFLGIFGWLEYGLDLFTYVFYILLINWVVWQTKLEKKLILSKTQTVFLSAGIITYYLLLLFINFLFWTEYKSKIVEGVQGRYFINVFPFFVYLLVNLRHKYPGKIKKIVFPKYLVFILGVFIIFLILKSIFFRFYY